MPNLKFDHKKVVIFIAIMIGSMQLLTGCKKTGSTTEEISNLLSIEYQQGPKIQINDVITALVWNNSSECMIFPLNYGIEIYTYINGEKLEIDNKAVYKGNDSRILKKKGDIDSFIFVGFSPDLSTFEISKSTEFTAEISGHLCDDDSIIITKKIPFVVYP
jgi:hypothetical protein